MSSANTLPESRTVAEILAHWKTTKFTGVAVVNVHLGIAKSIEWGRPDRVTLEHQEGQLEKNLLTTPASPP